MLKRVMISECVSCVPRVFLHASVVYVACGIEILITKIHKIFYLGICMIFM
jgi:hypothetical protein